MTSPGQREDRVPRPVHWSSADGLQLHAVAYDPPAPAGKLPVVCIPGLTRNARDFDELGPWLAERGRLALAVDLRGRGRSQYGPAARYRPATYADDVRRLLRAQGIARAHIIGTSLGGIVAMTMALGDRSPIAGAVLNDIGPELGAAGIARIASYTSSQKRVSLSDWTLATAAIRQVHQVSFPRLDDHGWRRLAERSFRRSDAGELLPDYDPAIVRGGAARPSRIVERLMWLGFRRLAARGPTLAIRGALSDLFVPETLARMKKVHPPLLSAEITDVGHAPTLDESESRAALEAFFSLVG
jgi:pimeloyl-ACP methyl ester carboxylesterase